MLLLKYKKSKKLRKFKTLVKTDFLRKSSNENLTLFKSKNDIYGMITNIILNDFSDVNSLQKTIIRFNDNFSKLDDFDYNLFRRFSVNCITTKRNLIALSYFITHVDFLKNEKISPILSLIKCSISQ